MKHTFLAIFLFTYSLSHAMEVSHKNNNRPSWATQLCLDGIKDKNLLKVKTALTFGADVNYTEGLVARCGEQYNDQSIFRKACAKGNNDIISLIISQPNLNLHWTDNFGDTPLHQACKLGLTTIVTQMLKINPKLATFRNQLQEIPLHIAAREGHNDCVKILLQYNGKNINARDNDSLTALHRACHASKYDIIQRLIENGASTTILNHRKETPLLYVYNGIYRKTHSFDILDKNSAKTFILAKDQHDNTQLHLCATTTTIENKIFLKEYLLFLVSKGINIHTKNKQGKTAIDLAYANLKELHDDLDMLSNSNLNPTLCTNKSKISVTQNIRTQQKIIKVLLDLSIEYAVYKEILFSALPKDAVAIIMSLYDALKNQENPSPKNMHKKMLLHQLY